MLESIRKSDYITRGRSSTRHTGPWHAHVRWPAARSGCHAGRKCTPARARPCAVRPRCGPQAARTRGRPGLRGSRGGRSMRGPRQAAGAPRRQTCAQAGRARGISKLLRRHAAGVRTHAPLLGRAFRHQGTEHRRAARVEREALGVRRELGECRSELFRGRRRHLLCNTNKTACA